MGGCPSADSPKSLVSVATSSHVVGIRYGPSHVEPISPWSVFRESGEECRVLWGVVLIESPPLNLLVSGSLDSRV